MQPTYKQSSHLANCTPCMLTCDKRKCERVHICALHNLHSPHTAALLPLPAPASRVSTLSARAVGGLRSDNKTPMIANTRKARWWGSRHLLSSKRAPSLSVCLSGLAAHQYYRCCCCHGQPQQLLAGLLKPAPGCQPAACLLYTINLCSLEMVQGCREAPRHNCPARLPKLRQQWSGRGESAGARNEWWGRMRMEPWRICKL